MRRVTLAGGIQTLGAVCSIAALVLVLSSSASIRVAVAILLVLGILAMAGPSLYLRRSPPDIGRDEMVATGNRLIQEAKSEVILFGGDMSWAQEREPAVRTAVARGKKVRVLFPASRGTVAANNAAVLQAAGAELIETPVDSGLRAILVDRQDPRDALLFIATRTARREAARVAEEVRSRDAYYRYVGRVYSMRTDWALLQAVSKIYEVLSGRPTA